MYYYYYHSPNSPVLGWLAKQQRKENAHSQPLPASAVLHSSQLGSHPPIPFKDQPSVPAHASGPPCVLDAPALHPSRKQKSLSSLPSSHPTWSMRRGWLVGLQQAESSGQPFSSADWKLHSSTDLVTSSSKDLPQSLSTSKLKFFGEILEETPVRARVLLT